ncbi:helix-turn-helix transcriptional regulator [Devosia ginsengisoli]|uniref:Helix-turn-helix transcriptional regulator n=1 Tax=Devosia ginsengisoli TaxID=400770 RepID=A0A5B8LVW9_9HYPH|nr:helix-turn-helix transcriptional regulator [Devosia ginsengisoli]QDZ11754.1 helix-turn-helix transcriptional regulator [Devosia ginsengisoli]
MERASAGVAALEAIGIPAAIISARGVAIASNSLFEALTDVLRPAAFGRLAARDRLADQLLQAALPGQGVPVPEVRSIPMRLVDSDRAIVTHVIPLQRSASDIFDQGAAMVAVSGYSAGGNVPTEPLLRGLFDLSVAEARIAAGLAAGLTLAEVAQQRGIGMATARTHLAQVLRKTGTRQQGQLIALLKGFGPGRLNGDG